MLSLMIRRSNRIAAVVLLAATLTGCASGGDAEALCDEVQAAMNTMRLASVATTVEALDPFIDKYREHAEAIRGLDGGEAIADGLDAVATAFETRDQDAGSVAIAELTVATSELIGQCQFE